MALKSKAQHTIGIDLRGTKILAAVVDSRGAVVATGKRPTKAELGPEAVIERITKTMDEALTSVGMTREQVAAIGIGAPGPVDTARGVVFSITNMPGWSTVPIAAILRKWRPVPVVLTNDMRAACMGELIASLGDLAPGQGLEATVQGQPVAVFNVSGTIRVIGGRCAHRGGPLGQGSLMGNSVLCPWHAWAYDLETGRCDVSAGAQVPVYEVRIEDGQILARAPG